MGPGTRSRAGAASFVNAPLTPQLSALFTGAALAAVRALLRRGDLDEHLIRQRFRQPNAALAPASAKHPHNARLASTAQHDTHLRSQTHRA